MLDLTGRNEMRCDEHVDVQRHLQASQAVPAQQGSDMDKQYHEGPPNMNEKF